jgi:hypothetical protein
VKDNAPYLPEFQMNREKSGLAAEHVNDALFGTDREEAIVR